MANSQSSTAIISTQPSESDIPAGRSVMIYNPGDPGVVEGLFLDTVKVKALAGWLCGVLHSRNEFCHECLNSAGFLLAETFKCTGAMVDASSPDKLVITIPIRKDTEATA